MLAGLNRDSDGSGPASGSPDHGPDADTTERAVLHWNQTAPLRTLRVSATAGVPVAGHLAETRSITDTNRVPQHLTSLARAVRNHLGSTLENARLATIAHWEAPESSGMISLTRGPTGHATAEITGHLPPDATPAASHGAPGRRRGDADHCEGSSARGTCRVAPRRAEQAAPGGSAARPGPSAHAEACGRAECDCDQLSGRLRRVHRGPDRSRAEQQDRRGRSRPHPAERSQCAVPAAAAFRFSKNVWTRRMPRGAMWWNVIWREHGGWLLWNPAHFGT